jgi:hypothetical protein
VCRTLPGADYDTEPWELYHLDHDWSECHDLAADQPDRLAELIALWWQPRPSATACCHSTIAPSSCSAPASATGRPHPTTAATCTGRRCRRSPPRRPQRSADAAPDLIARVSTRRRRRGVICSRPAPRTPASRCSSRAIAWSSTTTRSTTTRSSSPTVPVPAGDVTLHRPPLAVATAAPPAPSRSRSTARARAARRHPALHAHDLLGRHEHRLRPRLRRVERYRGRSRTPAAPRGRHPARRPPEADTTDDGRGAHGDEPPVIDPSPCSAPAAHCPTRTAPARRPSSRPAASTTSSTPVVAS